MYDPKYASCGSVPFTAQMIDTDIDRYFSYSVFVDFLDDCLRLDRSKLIILNELKYSFIDI